MKIQVIADSDEEFVEDTDFAYKDGKIYKIMVSKTPYMVGCMLGKMRVIIDDDGEVVQWIYPMLSAGEYQILNQVSIDAFRKIVSTFDQQLTNKQ